MLKLLHSPYEKVMVHPLLRSERSPSLLHSQVATDLYAGAHGEVSIRLLLNQLVDSNSKHSLAKLGVYDIQEP